MFCAGSDSMLHMAQMQQVHSCIKLLSALNRICLAYFLLLYNVFFSLSVTINSLINKQLKARVYEFIDEISFYLLIIHITCFGHI
jgi:hypothetical protein